MLAARLNFRTHRLSMEEVAVPEPGPGQVRIRVAAAGVCLSDVHLIDGSLSPLHLAGDSVTLGHEIAGTVDALGEGVESLREGQRVLLVAGEAAGDRILTRGVDYDGGWAEYALANVITVVPIPDSLSFEQAAIIPDAVSTPWAAVSTTAAVRAGEAVGVWGVGGLGVHALQLLRLSGAVPIIAVDPLPAARERALAFGADLALDPADPDLDQQVREMTGGRGLAVAFDFAGVPAVREQAVVNLAMQGRLVLVGIANAPLVITNGGMFGFMEQQVRGHYGSRPEHIDELLTFVRHGRLDLAQSITEVIPLADAPRAVERLMSKDGNPIRFILQP